MIKKTIEFVDYNGIIRKEEHYFNLTQAEIAEMELEESGGFGEKLKKIVEANDMPQIVKVFKTIIEKSYGVKSPDGRRFIKSKEVFEDFSQTEAYSTLFMELATDADKAAEFIKGIMPVEAVTAAANAI